MQIQIGTRFIDAAVFIFVRFALVDIHNGTGDVTQNAIKMDKLNDKSFEKP